MLSRSRFVLSGGAGRQRSTTQAGATAAVGGTTHYSFGRPRPAADKQREKKDFRDLFEFKDTVAQDAAAVRDPYPWSRVFWARPFDHADDAELDQKKDYERSLGMRGHYKSMYELGEDTIARVSPPGSRFLYLRQNLGGLLTLQLVIQVALTAVCFVLCEAGAIRGQWLQDTLNGVLPFQIELVPKPRKQEEEQQQQQPAASEATPAAVSPPVVAPNQQQKTTELAALAKSSKPQSQQPTPAPAPQPKRPKTPEELAAEDGWWWPFTTLPPAQLSSLHTANAIGSYTLPLQLAATWYLHARARAWYEGLHAVRELRHMARRAVDGVERAKKRPNIAAPF